MDHARGLLAEVEQHDRPGAIGAVGRLLGEAAVNIGGVPVSRDDAATKAAQGLCVARFEAFGCAGHAHAIKPLPLEAMVRRYV